MQKEILKKIDSLLEISKKYGDIIGIEAANLQSEYQLPTSGEVEKNIGEMKEKSRLLRIGIIGKVKAGKSSLLNSVLFNGRNLLPKAATPMTASLAIISHGEKFGARVEYFTRDDILKIKEKASAYKIKLDQAIAAIRERHGKKNQDRMPALPGQEQETAKQEKELIKEARRMVRSPALEAAWDHYERMKNSGLLEEFEKGVSEEVVSSESETQFLESLHTYLGSDGKKMPFTRSVQLFFPQENLKELAIIDTPGLDDPVPSRSERTNEYLAQCDVVLVISPAAEFLTDEDINLMDRLSGREGLGVIKLVASQVDTQLSAQSIVEDCEGDLPRAYKYIQKELSAHAREHLKVIVNEELGAKAQFGSLAEKKGSKVMLTSATAYALKESLDDRSEWDAAMKKTHELLQKNYPDYMDDNVSAKNSLQMLGGIEEIRQIFNDARLAKDEILANRLQGMLAGIKVKADGYAAELLASINDKINILENSDKAELERQRKELVRAQTQGSEAVDAAFDEAMDIFRAKLRSAIDAKRKQLFEETQAQVKNEEFERTKTRNWTTGWWIFKKHHSENYTVSAIRPGAVRTYLNSLRTDLESSLQGEVENQITDWKNMVQAGVARALRETVDIELISLAAVKSAIRKQINSLEIPEIDLSEYAFSNTATGVLEGSEAEEYLDKAMDHLTAMRHKTQELSKEFIRKLDDSVRKFKISETLFADLDSQLRNLEEMLEARNASLTRLRKCAEEVAHVQ